MHALMPCHTENAGKPVSFEKCFYDGTRAFPGFGNIQGLTQTSERGFWGDLPPGFFFFLQSGSILMPF